MREILFRGKSLRDGEWVFGYYFVIFESKHFIRVPTNDGLQVLDIEVEPETVGQFTGLLDKNGNKIFEGDIVKSKYNQLTEIKFGEFVDTKSHEQVGFYQVYLKDDTWDGVSSGNMDYVKDSEIIGNIHDNKELENNEK